MTAFYWLISALVVAFGAFWVVTPAPTIKTPVERSGRVSYVIDGDTFIVTGSKQKIRLWGVDAPESNQSGGQAATNHLHKLAHGQKVTCKQMDVDRYGRSVARCFLSDGREINRLMIESGKTQEYYKFSKGFYSSK